MEFSSEELNRLTLLRSLEWGYMPLFATQVFVPISFLFIKWWYVPVALVGATWLWHPIKYKLANFRVATFVCLINTAIVRWPVGLGFGVFYLIQGNFLLAVLSAFWPIAVLVLMKLCPPTINGILQRKFAAQIQGEDV